MMLDAQNTTSVMITKKGAVEGRFANPSDDQQVTLKLNGKTIATTTFFRPEGDISLTAHAFRFSLDDMWDHVGPEDMLTLHCGDAMLPLDTAQYPVRADAPQEAVQPDVTFDVLLAAIAERAKTWKWDSAEEGDQLRVNFSTHGPMQFDITKPEVAEWLRDAHKDGWTIEPFSCLVLETMADLFGLTTAMDIGTHYGFISQFLLRMPQMTRVDGVEMNPFAAAVVAANHKLSPALAADTRFHMHLAGLSDHSAMNQTVWYEGMRLAFEKQGRFQEAQLDILSLSDLIGRIGDMPELIKIDIEGFEGRLVDDLNTLLDHHRPKVLLELHWDEIVERHGHSRRDIMMAFLSRGYRCGRLQWHQKMPKAGFMQETTLENLDEMLATKNHAMYALF